MLLNRRGALAGAGGLMTALATGEAWAQDARRVRKAASSLSFWRCIRSFLAWSMVLRFCTAALSSSSSLRVAASLSSAP